MFEYVEIECRSMYLATLGFVLVKNIKTTQYCRYYCPRQFIIPDDINILIKSIFLCNIKYIIYYKLVTACPLLVNLLSFNIAPILFNISL